MKTGKLVLAFALVVGLMKPALAVENQYLDGRAFDPAKLEPAEPACDAYCDLVVNKAGKAKNLIGDGAWAEPDDQWCANHAVGTNPAVVANPPTGNKPTTPCNLPLLPGDGTCVDVNRRIQQCKLRGSQVETKCAAYSLLKEAGKFEKVVMGLDTAAAASCGMACAGNFVPGGAALHTACAIAGTSASASEFIHAIKIKSAKVMNLASLGGTGLAAAFSIKGLTDIGEGNKGDAVSKERKANSCKAAYTFAALTGLRAFNIKSQKDAKKKACTGIRELVSEALTFNAKPGASSGSGSSSGASTAATSSSGSTGSGSSGTVNTNNIPTLTAKDQKGAVLEAAAWVKANRPEFFTSDNRQNAYDMMTVVINILRANGHNVARVLNHPGLRPAPGAWGSDALAYREGTQWRIVDIYASWPQGPAQFLDHGLDKDSRGDVTSDLGPVRSAATAVASSGGSTGASTNTVTPRNVVVAPALVPVNREYGDCLKDRTCTNQAYQSAATDGGLLQDSGLGNAVRSTATGLNMERMIRHLENGGNPDSLLNTAMGGRGGSVAAEMGRLSNAVHADAAKINAE